MNSGNLIMLGIIAFIIVLIAVVAVTGTPKRGDKQRGTMPGKGHTVHRVHMPAPSSSMGTSRTVTIRHTKDPQKHAQAMMPAKARKKD